MINNWFIYIAYEVVFIFLNMDDYDFVKSPKFGFSQG